MSVGWLSVVFPKRWAGAHPVPKIKTPALTPKYRKVQGRAMAFQCPHPSQFPLPNPLVVSVRLADRQRKESLSPLLKRRLCWGKGKSLLGPFLCNREAERTWEPWGQKGLQTMQEVFITHLMQKQVQLWPLIRKRCTSVSLSLVHQGSAVL